MIRLGIGFITGVIVWYVIADYAAQRLAHKHGYEKTKGLFHNKITK